MRRSVRRLSYIFGSDKNVISPYSVNINHRQAIICQRIRQIGNYTHHIICVHGNTYNNVNVFKNCLHSTRQSLWAYRIFDFIVWMSSKLQRHKTDQQKSGKEIMLPEPVWYLNINHPSCAFAFARSFCDRRFLVSKTELNRFTLPSIFSTFSLYFVKHFAFWH